MKDITQESYAKWLEELLKNLFEFKPERIAFIAMNAEGETATSYYNCDASDMAMFDGVIQQDALFSRIEANKVWLKSLIESAEDGE